MDNSIISFGNNLDNGIHISTFLGRIKDRELESLMPFLKSLSDVDDVRTKLKEHFGIAKAYNEYVEKKQQEITKKHDME